MASPIFYVIFYVTGFALSDQGGLIEAAVVGIWGLMKDFTSAVFLAGTGPEQKDVHLILTFLLPSFIAATWWGVETVTGLKSWLERNDFIQGAQS
ncbi:hypothetical protein F3I62_18940 [Pseudomonas sp. R-28-1W-6]|uniref:hypothetical protein n=1 Tax=Pseudomonas sp. R-28-1W-6 TaxID=2650101 RepID=UPI00136532BF|nr:hypothetical protein [Pseudomonas sp. R-28-1W-6]MWV14182.1 hypothetical protein [Pseudomonas sp. R-28-1W-6]